MNGVSNRVLLIEEPNSSGDNIEFVKTDDYWTVKDGLHIKLENPWAGSTDEGFGQTTSITLTREQVQKLIEWWGT
jgi:hypothetical protein